MSGYMSYYVLVAAIVTLNAIGPTAGIRCLLGSQDCSCGQDCTTTDTMTASMKALDREECPEAKQFQKSPSLTEMECPNADDLCIREVNLLLPRSPTKLVGKVSYRLLRAACVTKKTDPTRGPYYQPVTLNNSFDISKWGWPLSWPGVSNFADRSYVCSDVWWPLATAWLIKFDQAHVFCLCKTDLCNLDPKSMGLPSTRPPAGFISFTVDPGVVDTDDLLLVAQMTSDKTRPKLEKTGKVTPASVTSATGETTTVTPTGTTSTSASINAVCGDFPDSETCRDGKSRTKNSAVRIVVEHVLMAMFVVLTVVR